MFGTPLAEGDTICFNLNLGRTYKPLVRATVAGFADGDWIVIGAFLPSAAVDTARDYGKLNKKIMISRVVKCF